MALTYASYQNNFEIAKFLIEHIADVNHQENVFILLLKLYQMQYFLKLF
jgi:hypothetical protein